MVSDKEEPWLEGIVGDDARRLITSDAPLIRVVAGPGAGKTTCLKRRVQRLVGRHPKDRRVTELGLQLWNSRVRRRSQLRHNDAAARKKVQDAEREEGGLDRWA